MLTKHGVSREDADYYEHRINEGGIFVSVNTEEDRLSHDQIEDILYRHGGHSTRRARSAAM